MLHSRPSDAKHRLWVFNHTARRIPHDCKQHRPEPWKLPEQLCHVLPLALARGGHALCHGLCKGVLLALPAHGNPVQWRGGWRGVCVQRTTGACCQGQQPCIAMYRRRACSACLWKLSPSELVCSTTAHLVKGAHDSLAIAGRH